MPSRNVIKRYAKNSFYHVYNRGVEKRKIFESDQDYAVFLSYLKQCLVAPPPSEVSNPAQSGYQIKNYSSSIELHGFVLMPNHYHFLIRQTDERAITMFFQSLFTRYTMYFNKHHDRVGSLFQGRYRAVTINDDEQLLQVSRYIHCNPLDLGYSLATLPNYTYSSFPYYLGRLSAPWVQTEFIYACISSSRKDAIIQYRDFIAKYSKQPDEYP